MGNRYVIKKVVGREVSDGAGVKLKRIIGQPALRSLDPFLMLDEFGSQDAQDYLAGFPSHPHRGFQTVTYMLDGKMGHKDSKGNAGTIGTGGIQWMNAGRGIIHEEMPQQSEGLLRGFQLWINLPAAEKMSEPGYQDISPERVPQLQIEDYAIVKVLAGTFQHVAGPISTQTVRPLFLDLSFSAAGGLSVPVSESANAFVYCYSEYIEIGETVLRAGELAVLSPGNVIQLSGVNNAQAILLAAEPIGEPVVQYGPFVMNTEQEINQALGDYQSGKLA